MQLIIEENGSTFIGTDLDSGWRMEYDHDQSTANGVVPLLAFKEALYVLEQCEKKTRLEQESFLKVFKYMESLYKDDAFEIPLVSFMAHSPHLRVRGRAVSEGHSFLSCLHAICTLIQESKEAKPNRNGVRLAPAVRITLLKADGKFRNVVLGQVKHQHNSPVVLGHPTMDFGIRAAVTLEDDGVTVKSIDGPIMFNVIG